MDDMVATDTATLSAAPSPAHLRATVTCPLARAAIVSNLARRWGTLPPPLAELRRHDLAHARRDGHKVVAIARRLRISSARISQLTGSLLIEGGPS